MIQVGIAAEPVGNAELVIAAVEGEIRRPEGDVVVPEPEVPVAQAGAAIPTRLAVDLELVRPSREKVRAWIGFHRGHRIPVSHAGMTPNLESKVTCRIALLSLHNCEHGLAISELTVNGHAGRTPFPLVAIDGDIRVLQAGGHLPRRGVNLPEGRDG